VIQVPTLGVGVVYVPGLEAFLETEPDRVAVIEIEPETLAYETPRQAERFAIDPVRVEWLRHLPQAKLVHGVGFTVGGTRVPDPRHVPPLERFIGAMSAPWASEHLAFNTAAGAAGPLTTGFLLPPRQTPAGAAAAARTIHEVATRLPVPFAVETGVNYLRPRPDELSDGAFVQAVTTAADCGILLDLHNVWANERNGRQAVQEFLAELPLERVWEVHLAGGLEMDGYWLDAHSGPVAPALLDLARDVVAQLPNLGALVFEIGPDFLPLLGEENLRRQLDDLWRVWEERGRRASTRRKRLPIVPPADAPAVSSDRCSPTEWEDALGSLVLGRGSDSPLAGELRADPGVGVLRRLVQEFRAGSLVEALKLSTRLLRLSLGEAAFRDLLKDFWSHTSPQLFASSEADSFAAFVRRAGTGVAYLEEVLSFEVALVRARSTGRRTRVRLHHHPEALLQPLWEGRLPADPPRARVTVVVGDSMAGRVSATSEAAGD
jgi:uncharacterized protein (UPF0276 family)